MREKAGLSAKIKGIVKRQWFIIGVISSIFFAKAAPWVGRKGGPLQPEVTIKLAVASIFLIIGLSLKTRQLKETLFQWRIHFTVQIFSLVVTPFLMCSVANALESVVDALYDIDSAMHKSLLSMLEGVKVLSCMPSPVSSAVILTKAVGGNEAAAVFNSTLGSFLGVLITPLMLLEITGASATVPVMSMLSSLGSQIIIPIILGQGIRNVLMKDPDAILSRFSFSKISSGILVLIIYTVFCETFSGTFEIKMNLLVCLIGFLLLAMISFLVVVYFLATTIFPSLSRADMVAILFCATHKSLTLGMPLLKILFEDHPEVSVAVISIPLLIYHPLQILLGSCLVSPMQRWMGAAREKVDDTSTEKLPL